MGNPDILGIALDSDSSPGWLPSSRLRVPFQIAGDVRIITMNLRFHNYEACETSLIHTKALLRYIESLPIKEGQDVDWRLYGTLLSECIPGRRRWDQGFMCFTIGMRYTLPEVIRFRGKLVIIICDICPRRCLRASEEERQESELLYQTLMNLPHGPDQSYPRSILKSVPLPENIPYPEKARLMISEDGIVFAEEVRHRNVSVSIAL